ncbi:hypothetical protein LWI28_000976 [Acer negundo]|uniref:Uncharacterized protein n=1 Tax=Acer negundo TaxID=4023 RepID=A0AAD5NTF5_ACENE|nr:hypothetical protein LWI28_000976 [Acer negundo]
MGNFEAKKVGKEMGHFGSSDGCMASDKDRKVSSGENNYGRRLTTVDVNDGQNLFNNFAYDEEKWADSAISLDNLKSFFRSQVYVEEKWAHNMQLFRAIFPEVQL